MPLEGLAYLWRAAYPSGGMWRDAPPSRVPSFLLLSRDSDLTVTGASDALQRIRFWPSLWDEMPSLEGILSPRARKSSQRGNFWEEEPKGRV